VGLKKRLTKKQTVKLAGAGLLVVALAAAAGVRFRGQNPEEAYRPAPAFQLPDSAGKPHALQDLAGRPVILHFWAAWCAPCLDEIPVWVAAARQAQTLDPKVAWVAISLDTSWAEAAKIWKFTDLPANLWSLLDAKQKSAEAYGSYQFPETYLLDSKHRIIHKWVGPQDWAGAWVKELLSKIQGL
jgi:cytochrome c biogenesis protein CcmG/thiol:disulfide interchange protein DsbE